MVDFMMELSKRIEELLEKHDFSICGEITERYGEKGQYDIELETYSPEGEDVIVSLIYDGTEEGFIKAFISYTDDFDSEEHAEMWIESRGKNGVPDGIRDLLDDAEWIKNTLMEIAEELNNINNTEEGKEKLSIDEKLQIIRNILSERNGISENQEFGLSYSQAVNYLDEIEEIISR